MEIENYISIESYISDEKQKNLIELLEEIFEKPQGIQFDRKIEGSWALKSQTITAIPDYIEYPIYPTPWVAERRLKPMWVPKDDE